MRVADGGCKRQAWATKRAAPTMAVHVARLSQLGDSFNTINNILYYLLGIIYLQTLIPVLIMY